jgi:hypothetical protein
LELLKEFDAETNPEQLDDFIKVYRGNIEVLLIQGNALNYGKVPKITS